MSAPKEATTDWQGRQVAHSTIIVYSCDRGSFVKDRLVSTLDEGESLISPSLGTRSKLLHGKYVFSQFACILYTRGWVYLHWNQSCRTSRVFLKEIEGRVLSTSRMTVVLTTKTNEFNHLYRGFYWCL